MARKRLLTILAAAVAAIGLQVGSAAALDVDTDLAGVKVGVSVSDEGIEAKVGDEDDELEAKVSKDGVDAKVGDTKVSTDDVTEKVKEAAPDDEVDADDGGSSKEKPSSKESSPKESSSKESASGGEGSSGDTREVTAAGAADTEPVESDHERPDALDPAQARQFLPGSGDQPDLSGSRDDITPSFDLSGREDLDAPVVAAPPERPESSDAADWEAVEPPVTERSDAELAAIPSPADGNAVPAGLKLLAGLLVAGTGTLWHLTRRELGTPGTVRVG
jgi:hypothetical protein